MNLSALFTDRYLPHITRVLKPKTVAEYERLARVEILPRFGARDITTLTLDDAEALHGAVPGRVQANRAVSLLSGMLTYALERKLLTANPCRGIELNREMGCEFYYTPAQSKAILRTASSWDDIRAKFISLLLLTGARPGELLNSGPGWRHGAVLRTPDGKTGSRVVYLPHRACAILDSLPVLARTDLSGNVSDHYFPAGMDLRRAWDRLCREAGVPRARQYALRHTFASLALAAGVSLGVIGRMLGHRKAQTTLRYAHLAPDVGLQGAEAAAAKIGI